MYIDILIYIYIYIYIYKYMYLHISRILEARALEQVMVHHGGVRRNLGLPCEQSSNLDRAFNTQPHTNVIQVIKEPEVPPTRARKGVRIIQKCVPGESFAENSLHAIRSRLRSPNPIYVMSC